MKNFEEFCPDLRQKKFLLAVSGGVDSMVLFHLFQILKIQFEVAHINYGLRGKDSTKDQDLVEKICKEQKIVLHTCVVSAQDKKPKNSIQEWARNLRYNYFRKILESRNLDAIVTAHHLNDQLETFLINLSKASGIKGLSGIPQNENQIMRPLLIFSKKEIYDFAKLNEIEYREDLSNQKNDYLRNKIRNEIVPKLEETNDHFLPNFGKSLTYLNQTKKFAEDQILQIEKQIITLNESFISIKKDLFLKESNYVQFEILRKFGFKDELEIEKIKKAETGKVFISADFQLRIDRKTFLIKNLNQENPSDSMTEIILEVLDDKIILPKNIEEIAGKAGLAKWKINADEIEFPLKFRKRKEGDVFFPTGMTGKKKVSKFFKDEKIPLLIQEEIWILSDAEDKILGVFPYRQDRRFIPKENSKIITLSI